ncbi:MAG: hypothetical protein JNK09_15705 [Prolixibacteraceae bacterium]|nr:hypothetical protein [Prolixibacteraceae bacterium]
MMTNEELFKFGCELVKTYAPVMPQVEIKFVEPVKEPAFTARQLQFSRDAQQQLISKYKNKKFSAYKKQILDEIIKKYNHAKKQKKELDEKVKIYEDFLKEINPLTPDVLTIDLSQEKAA